MNILVTGGCGYIGSHIVFQLKDLGHQIHVLDSLVRSTMDNCKAEIMYTADIRDEEALKEIFSKTHFDLVCHFAGLASAPESIEEPDWYYDVNVEGTKTLLKVMKEFDCNKLIFPSTALLYESSKSPLSEDSPVKPLSNYAKNKLEIEQFLKKQDWLDYITFRCFNVIGYSGWYGLEHEYLKTAIGPSIARAYKYDKPFNIYGNCYGVTRQNKRDHTCVRDYVDIRDIANAYVLAIDFMQRNKHCKETFNLGSGEGHSVLEFLRGLRKVSPDMHLKYRLVEPRKGDPDILIADSQKAKELLHWQSDYSTIK